ncbi:hypothetical protein [Pseudonocardia aurantiaca]|uniref:Alpha/beta fold hydrolase n=1 Tax=Pseudonocardia aurantiaca TaxID=75290 RepID=A0ABW4FL21_9PSEU
MRADADGLVDVGGVPTWYAEHGSGEPLVYLHGEFSDSRDLGPDAELAVVPGTSHVLVIEKPHRVQELALEFLTADPVPTIMPIRRASTTDESTVGDPGDGSPGA